MSSKGVFLFSAIFLFSSIMLMATTSSLSNIFKVYAADNCDVFSRCRNDPGLESQINNCTKGSEFGSLCVNSATGTGNAQSNNCSDQGCFNVANGNGNDQNNRCGFGPSEFGCSNTANGNDNIQKIDCDLVFNVGCENVGNGNDQNLKCNSADRWGCNNLAEGNGNNQNMDCFKVLDRFGCFNDSTGNDNTQNLQCFRVGDHCGNLSLRTSSNTQTTVCANSGACENSGENTNVISNGAEDCESHGPDTTTKCQPGRTIIRPNS